MSAMSTTAMFVLAHACSTPDFHVHLLLACSAAADDDDAISGSVCLS